MSERREVAMVNQRGLHARASAKFVNAVSLLPEGHSVKVTKDGTSAGGGSILGLMMLGAAKGDAVTIAVDGPEAARIADELEALVASGFGED